MHFNLNLLLTMMKLLMYIYHRLANPYGSVVNQKWVLRRRTFKSFCIFRVLFVEFPQMKTIRKMHSYIWRIIWRNRSSSSQINSISKWKRLTSDKSPPMIQSEIKRQMSRCCYLLVEGRWGFNGGDALSCLQKKSVPSSLIHTYRLTLSLLPPRVPPIIPT